LGADSSPSSRKLTISGRKLAISGRKLAISGRKLFDDCCAE
jgi:hypothetical protein